MAKPDPLTINHLVILTCLNEDKVEVEKLARIKSTGGKEDGPPPDFLGEIEVEPIRGFDDAERRAARQELKINPAGKGTSKDECNRASCMLMAV